MALPYSFQLVAHGDRWGSPGPKKPGCRNRREVGVGHSKGDFDQIKSLSQSSGGFDIRIATFRP